MLFSFFVMLNESLAGVEKSDISEVCLDIKNNEVLESFLKNEPCEYFLLNKINTPNKSGANLLEAMIFESQPRIVAKSIELGGLSLRGKAHTINLIVSRLEVDLRDILLEENLKKKVDKQASIIKFGEIFIEMFTNDDNDSEFVSALQNPTFIPSMVNVFCDARYEDILNELSIFQNLDRKFNENLSLSQEAKKNIQRLSPLVDIGIYNKDCFDAAVSTFSNDI